MHLRASEPEERGLSRALAVGPLLLAQARATGIPQVAASLIHGPAVVLGALQRAGRVVDLPACAAAATPVFRRATTGPAVYVGGTALLWSLALPHVAALAPDATARTLLNRNVRGFLRGLSRGGAVAHYFGREWIAMKHRPVVLLGFDMLAGGAVLLEAFAGVDASIALPPVLATQAERGVDRWLGKAPAALADVLAPPVDAATIAAAVITAIAARAGFDLEHCGLEGEGAEASLVEDAKDPVPAGFAEGPLLRVPIGWLDTAVDVASRRVWLGGDVLAPLFAVDAIAGALGSGEEAPDLAHVPIEGATATELIHAAREALRAASR